MIKQVSFKVWESVPSQFGEIQDKRRFKSSLETIKEDIQNLMYSLSRTVWENASRTEALESGTDFSKALKVWFSKLKTLDVRDSYSKEQFQFYWESEIKRIFKNYCDGIDEDEEDDIQRVLQNQDTLIAAVSKVFSKNK